MEWMGSVIGKVANAAAAAVAVAQCVCVGAGGKVAKQGAVHLKQEEPCHSLAHSGFFFLSPAFL